MAGNRSAGRGFFESIDITNSRVHVGETHAHFHPTAYGELYNRAIPLPALQATLEYKLLRSHAVQLQLENSILRDQGSIGNRERPVGTTQPSLTHHHTEQWANPQSNNLHAQSGQSYLNILHSLPRYQFHDQVNDEEERLSATASRSSNGPREAFHNQAIENVKMAWKKRGIWNDKWNDARIRGRWKHEEPLLSAERKPRRRKSRNIAAAQRAQLEKDRDASRPMNQFLDELSIEVDTILTSGGQNGIDGPIVNTRASQNVKERWWRRGVWDEEWGDLPGMMWKHEHKKYSGLVDEFF